MCNKCGEWLPINYFYQRKDRPKEITRICRQCAARKQREYYHANPDKAKEISSRTREKNRDIIRQRNREFYARVKDDPQHIAARKASAERNKDKWYEKEKKRRESFNSKWKHPCEKCGENRLYLIQFHHINPSTKSFCIGAAATYKKESVLVEEVKKCVCLCSNCHDEFHYFYGSKPNNPISALEEYLGRSL